MAKNSILYRGNSYNIKITVTDQNGDPVDWDSITDFILSAYSLKSLKAVATFDVSDLTIDDPTSGIAYANITGDMTESAEEELYIIEYKYKTASEEIGRKGYWGRFVKMKHEKEHFNPGS